MIRTEGSFISRGQSPNFNQAPRAIHPLKRNVLMLTSCRRNEINTGVFFVTDWLLIFVTS